MRFAVPILAEQALVIAKTQAMTFAKARLGDSGRTLNESVWWNVADKGALMSEDMFDQCWTAQHLPRLVLGRAVRLRQPQEAPARRVGGRRPRRQRSCARNRLASELGYVEPGRRGRPPAPLPPPAKPAAKRPARPRAALAKEGAATRAAAKRPAKKRAAAKKAAAKKNAKQTAAKRPAWPRSRAEARRPRNARPRSARAVTRPAGQEAPSAQARRRQAPGAEARRPPNAPRSRKHAAAEAARRPSAQPPNGRQRRRRRLGRTAPRAARSRPLAGRRAREVRDADASTPARPPARSRSERRARWPSRSLRHAPKRRAEAIVEEAGAVAGAPGAHQHADAGPAARGAGRAARFGRLRRRRPPGG